MKKKGAIKEAKTESEDSGKLLAAVMVRGKINTERKAKETLESLGLSRVNHCVLVPKKPVFEGMLKRARHSITWGEISADMLEKMVYKRGRFQGDKRVDKKDAKKIAGEIFEGKSKLKKIFRLTPPSGGYKSVNLPYPKGDTGYRGEKINDLLKRMI